ncbi:hypothetical protein F5X99DRAFT_404709 [Biscogniauxia marginata]|nr:hypothetical protein F5X99DRAFT_404709 [Biscogniauxia marginata]
MEFLEPGGYDRLAEYMARHPQLGIFRRFGALAYETLLYYQAEISELECRLRSTQAEDRNSENENRRDYGRAWNKIMESAALEDHDNPEREQYDLIIRLRKLMGEYEKALYYHEPTLSLRRPHRKLLEDLQEWMERPSLGRIEIHSCDWKTWSRDKEIEDDLVTFENSTMDQFTSLVTYKLVDVYHSILGRHIHKKRNENEDTGLPVTNADHRHMVTYPHRTIARFTRTTTVLMACMFPIVAIVILYTIEDMKKRLGIIAGLTGFFSIAMEIFTMATLPEIFAATAAFSAVLVVFIGASSST